MFTVTTNFDASAAKKAAAARERRQRQAAAKARAAAAEAEAQAGQVNVDVDGTSASTPVVAGMIALMKSKLGKKLGMVAPLLYALPVGSDVFNDITEGSNGCSSTCCGKAGFPATKGWDAATGLGSLDAGKLLAALPGMIREAERNSGDYVYT